MQYFLSVNLEFTEDTVSVLESSLPRPHVFNYGRVNHSQLVTAQVKKIMYKIYRKSMENVMIGLQKRLNKKATKENWTTSFCIIVILCMIAEMVQISKDIYVVYQLDSISREESEKFYHRLDERIIGSTTSIFHGSYHTLPRGRKSAKIFNPLRNGLGTAASVLPNEVQQLVTELQSIIQDHSEWKMCLLKSQINLSSH